MASCRWRCRATCIATSSSTRTSRCRSTWPAPRSSCRTGSRCPSRSIRSRGSASPRASTSSSICAATRPTSPYGRRVMADVVEIFDTTLRDGTQREGVSLSAADKLRIAERLDQLGVAFIEGGWPGSNPKDAELFARARERKWQHAEIVAFGATRRAEVRPADDASVRALAEAGTRVVAIFGKTWTLHVDRVLRVARDENLKMIEETVAWLRAQGKRVIYDAEHFFDGWRADPAYAMATLQAAARGGAETVVLCDTNGGSLPWQVADGVRVAVAALPSVKLGIHAHDDAGCGVANTLAAVRAGARHVQGTINGWGER